MARTRASVVFRGPAPTGGIEGELQRFADRLGPWLLRTLRQLGAHTADEPGLDGPRWHVDFEVEGKQHRFLVEPGGPGTWTGRVIRTGSFLAGLRQATPAALGMIRRALAAAPEVSAISWRDPA
jgi:hypothetical protein